MLYRALKTFCGKVTMHKGQEKAITDESVVADLIRAGYIEEVKPQKKNKEKE